MKLSDLVSQTEEMKIQLNEECRLALVGDHERLRKCLGDREEEIARRKEDSKREQKMEDERRLYELRERQQEHARELWKENWKQNYGKQKTAVSSTMKLPKLKITAFKGTAGDWVRFENMFLTQVDFELT